MTNPHQPSKSGPIVNARPSEPETYDSLQNLWPKMPVNSVNDAITRLLALDEEISKMGLDARDVLEKSQTNLRLVVSFLYGMDRDD